MGFRAGGGIGAHPDTTTGTQPFGGSGLKFVRCSASSAPLRVSRIDKRADFNAETRRTPRDAELNWTDRRMGTNE